MTNVVIVESPAKAKTINKYLGADYTVLASFGHIRDLPPKDGSVKPDDDFSMIWSLDDRGEQRIAEITRALKSADTLYLATDPDREGEAISWHIKEVLGEKRALKDKKVRRVTFNEITKSAVQEAFANARDIDSQLVEAYLARRALDYLVGFNISPILWRKLPGSRSAGRVQSVALRLICEREAEIEAFKSQEYWSIVATFQTAKGQIFEAHLTHFAGKKLDKFSIPNKDEAERILAVLQAQQFQVADIEKKTVRRNPYAPFITSTLQQEASRKLGLTASRTMRLAQQLYEGVEIGGETVGLITYMRTDGITLSGEAIASARRFIERDFGKDYLPDSPRAYKSQAKNAQEAHEAIRPTDVFRTPQAIAKYLDADQARLYELIWKRTVACQMESAVLDQVGADIASADKNNIFRATGSVVVFDGFLKLYQETREEGEDDEQSSRLPPLNVGDSLQKDKITPNQHFTQPPPRYSEASLVKKMEELGIGRPSTYASIIQVLQDRDYVVLDKKRFVPEDRGRVVTTFLTGFFSRYVEYGFTAGLEEQLDDISAGKLNWKQVLRDFWRDFIAAVDQCKDLTITQVIDKLDADLGPHFFPVSEGGKDPRLCPNDGGRLGLKLGKFGAFIGCSNYPECRFTKQLAVEKAGAEGELGADFPSQKELGIDPQSQMKVTIRKGPYGFYVQLGETVAKGEKPKRMTVPKTVSPHDIDLEKALILLALPRDIGKHPETGDTIAVGIGRFGPFLKHGAKYVTLPPTDDIFTIGMNRAVAVIAEAKDKPAGRFGGGGGANAAKVLGNHPSDGKPVKTGKGRFGPYVAYGKIFASIPKSMEPDSITLDQAVELIDAKIAKGGGKAGKSKGKAKKSDAAESSAEAKPKRSRKKTGGGEQ